MGQVFVLYFRTVYFVNFRFENVPKLTYKKVVCFTDINRFPTFAVMQYKHKKNELPRSLTFLALRTSLQFLGYFANTRNFVCLVNYATFIY